MSYHNIFAYTEPTPPEGFPAFVSINRDAEGRHTITVRSRCNACRTQATIEVSPETLEALHLAVAADLYREK